MSSSQLPDEELSETFASAAMSSLSTLDRIFTNHTSPEEATEIACLAVEIIADAVVLPNGSGLPQQLRNIVTLSKELIATVFQDTGLDAGGESVKYLHRYEALDREREKLDKELARHLPYPASTKAKDEMQTAGLEAIARMRDDMHVAQDVRQGNFDAIGDRFAEEFKHISASKRTLKMNLPELVTFAVVPLGKEENHTKPTRIGGLIPGKTLPRTSRMSLDRPDVLAQAAGRLREKLRNMHEARTVQSAGKDDDNEKKADSSVAKLATAEYEVEQFFTAIEDLRGGKIGRVWHRIKDVLARLFVSTGRDTHVITMRSRLLSSRETQIRLEGGSTDTKVALMLQHMADDKDSYDNDWLEKRDVVTIKVIAHWHKFVALKELFDKASTTTKPDFLKKMEAEYKGFVSDSEDALSYAYEKSPIFSQTLDYVHSLKVLRQSKLAAEKMTSGHVFHVPVKIARNKTARLVSEDTTVRLSSLAAKVVDSGLSSNSDASITVNLVAFTPLFTPPGLNSTLAPNTSVSAVDVFADTTTVFTTEEDDLPPGITDMATGKTVPVIPSALPEESASIIDKASEWKNGYSGDLPPDIVSAYFSSTRVLDSEKMQRFPQLFAYVNGVGKLEADADKKATLSTGSKVDVTFEIHVRQRFQELTGNANLLPAQLIVDIEAAYKSLGQQPPKLFDGEPSTIEPAVGSALYNNIKFFIRAYIEMAEVHRLSDHYFYGFVFGTISGRKEVEKRLLDTSVFYNVQYRRLRIATQALEQGPVRGLYDNLARLNFSLSGTADIDADERGVLESTRFKSGDEINLPGFDLKGKIVQYDSIRTEDDGAYDARMESFKRQNGGKLPTLITLRSQRVCTEEDTAPCDFVDITQEKSVEIVDGSVLIRNDFDEKRTVIMRVFDPQNAQYIGSALLSASLAIGRAGGQLAATAGGSVNDAIREQRTALRGESASLAPEFPGEQADFAAFTQTTNKIPQVGSWFDLLLGEKLTDVREALKSVVSFGSFLDADVHKSLSRGFLALESVAYMIDLALRAAGVFGGFVSSYLSPVDGHFRKVTSHLYKCWDWLIVSSIVRYFDFQKERLSKPLQELWERVKKWGESRKKDQQPVLDAKVPRAVLQTTRKGLRSEVRRSGTNPLPVPKEADRADDDVDDDEEGDPTFVEIAAEVFKTVFGYAITFIKLIGDLCLNLVAYDVSNFSASPLRSLMRVGVRTATVLMLAVALPATLLNLGTFTKAFVVSSLTHSAALALSAVLAEIVQYAAERVVGPYNDPTVRNARTDVIKKAILVLGSFGVTYLPFGTVDVMETLAFFDPTGSGVLSRVGNPFRFPGAVVVSDQVSNIVKSAETAEMVMFAGRAAAQLFTPMIFALLGRTSATLDAESTKEQSRKVAEALTHAFIEKIREEYENDRFMETSASEFRTQRRVYELLIKFSLDVENGELVPVEWPQLSQVGANLIKFVTSSVHQADTERRMVNKKATPVDLLIMASSLVQVGSKQLNRPTVFSETVDAALEGVDISGVLTEMVAAYAEEGEVDPYTPHPISDDSSPDYIPPTETDD
jgi:hypothetical protein